MSGLPIIGSGSGGGGVWGAISGTLSNQTDLQNALNLKKNLVENTISTTNNTPTTIRTFATASNISYSINVIFSARRTDVVGDTASFRRSYLVKNIGGTVSIVLTQTDFTAKDNPNLDVTASVSGTNILFRVIGETGQNYNWKSSIEWSEV